MFIYRFENKEKEVLYVGKTTMKLNARIVAHLSPSGFLPLEFFKNWTNTYYTEYESEYEMMIQEILWIGYYKPKYNKQYNMEEKLTRRLECIIINDKWIPYNCKENINDFAFVLAHDYYKDTGKIYREHFQQTSYNFCLCPDNWSK